MNTKQVKLGSLCTITSSKRIFESEYVEEGIPFYRSKEIIERESGKTTSSNIHITKERYNEIKEKFGVPKPNEMLITSVGTLGVPYIVKDNDLFYFKDGNLTWLKNFSKALNSRYLYYWIKSDFGKQSLVQRAIGSSQPAITIDILKKYQILIPDIIYQNKIVSVLSIYDDLIEKNNRKIEILQDMAEELYKEWFTRRRNSNWETVKLNQFGYDIESGNRPKGGIDASLKEGIPSLGAESIDKLGIFDFTNVKLIPNEFYRKMKRGLGKDKDILLYKDGAYIGKVTLFMDKFPYEEYAVNEHVFLIRAKNELYQYYLYYTLNQKQYFTQMQNLNRNAAQPGLTPKDLDIIKLCKPDEPTIRRFNCMIEPILHNIFKIAKQNENLKTQRDLLLPRLMSGKLAVKVS